LSFPFPLAAAPAAPPGGFDLPVVAAVLLAAVLHAVWNSLAKTVRDQLAGFAMLNLASLTICLAALALVPGPAAASRPFIAGSALLHVGYQLALMRSYGGGELSQVYPLARGVAPLLVAAFAAAVVGERIGPAQLCGIVLISCGLASLAFGGRRPSGAERPAVAFALVTGVFIAAYTVTDGLGVRRAGGAPSYATWLFLSESTLVLLIAVALRGRSLGPAVRPVWWRGAVGGALSLAAYGLVLWAQTRGALAAVAALRETSVVIAAAIGTLFLGERFGRLRVLAACLVAAGILLLDLH
jgi:drug/metabolite transporter (DMT)-like permease